jgi:menaquinol-cytochrome c reductase iron-sulfur subunit
MKPPKGIEPVETKGNNSTETDRPGVNTHATSSAPALPERRVFFERLVEMAAGCVAVLLAIPFVRFLLYPVGARSSANVWSKLGPANRFASLAAPVSCVVTTRQSDGWLQSQAQKPVYITRNARGRLEVLSAVCPHLGCTVQWEGSKNEFICPCHGSVFAPNGARLAGPAPRGMDSLPLKVQDGLVWVQYQQFRQLLPEKEVLD